MRVYSEHKRELDRAYAKKKRDLKKASASALPIIPALPSTEYVCLPFLCVVAIVVISERLAIFAGYASRRSPKYAGVWGARRCTIAFCVATSRHRHCFLFAASFCATPTRRFSDVRVRQLGGEALIPFDTCPLYGTLRRGQEKTPLKANKAAMRRADTYKVALDLFTNFGIAGTVFFCGLASLFPRLGRRAANIALCGLVICFLLYVFIVQGFANAFVVFVQRSAYTLLFPSAGGNVAEF